MILAALSFLTIALITFLFGIYTLSGVTLEISRPILNFSLALAITSLIVAFISEKYYQAANEIKN